MKCEHCGEEFDGHGNAKYCPDCRSKVRAEYTRRYRENHRKQRPKPVAKSVEKPVKKLRPLTKAELFRLLRLIKDAYDAGYLVVNFG